MGLSENSSIHRCDTVGKAFFLGVCDSLHTFKSEVFKFYQSNTVEVLLVSVCPKIHQFIGVTPLSNFIHGSVRSQSNSSVEHR
jgi:hypothetical protein